MCNTLGLLGELEELFRSGRNAVSVENRANNGTGGRC